MVTAPSFDLYRGDCRDDLRRRPDASVHCVLTSPPYYSLRDYAVPPGVWGGKADCAHVWGPEQQVHKGGLHGNGQLAVRSVADAKDGTAQVRAGAFCACGAWRGQLGLEPSPSLYVEHLVEVMREVRRILRPEGTLWLNLGDSYCGDGGQGQPTSALGAKGTGGVPAVGTEGYKKWERDWEGLKTKDLVGIPWAVAFALRADGWWLRSDIVWAKPNPMPESVEDRPTRAHEFVFILAKAGEPTFWKHRDGRVVWEQPPPDWVWRDRTTDQETNVEPRNWRYERLRAAARPELQVKETEQLRWVRLNRWRGWDYYYDADAIREAHAYGDHPRRKNSPRVIPGQKVHGGVHRVKTAATPHGNGRRQAPEPGEANAFHENGRNKRDVWAVPDELWNLFLEWLDRQPAEALDVVRIRPQPFPEAHFAVMPEELAELCIKAGCPPGGAVYDPFAGACTVGLVALRLGRSFAGAEVSSAYADMGEKRVAKWRSQSRLHAWGSA